MTEEKYTAEQLEQMADQLLQEAAPAQEKPAKGGLDEKTIASLPAAALLNGNEKLRDLFTKGKKKGKLDAGELSDVLDELDLESEQMDSIYDSLEQLGIEVGSEDFLADLPDEDGEPAMDEIAEIEEEELVDPNTLVDSFNIDDPVRMYPVSYTHLPWARWAAVCPWNSARRRWAVWPLRPPGRPSPSAYGNRNKEGLK